MKEFLEQLGFEDITSDNYLDTICSLNEYFEWDKPFHALYRRYADNGIITYIMHGTEGSIEYINIVSIYGTKWVKAHQMVPSKYIKDVTFDLLVRVEASILRL